MSGTDNEIGLRAGAVPTTVPLRGTAADDRQGSGGDRHHSGAMPERGTIVDPKPKPSEVHEQTVDGTVDFGEMAPDERGVGSATSRLRMPGDTDKAGRAGEAGGSPAPQTLQIITLFEAAIDNRAEGNALLRRLVELAGEMNFRLARIEVALVSKETAPENIVPFLRPVPHEGKVR